MTDALETSRTNPGLLRDVDVGAGRVLARSDRAEDQWPGRIACDDQGADLITMLVDPPRLRAVKARQLLGRTSGVPQPNPSAYENGRRATSPSAHSDWLRPAATR